MRKCNITREQFEQHARPLEVQIDNVLFKADVHESKAGSFGWYLSGKSQIVVDGHTVDVQIGCSITVIGSKHV